MKYRPDGLNKILDWLKTQYYNLLFKLFPYKGYGIVINGVSYNIKYYNKKTSTLTYYLTG